MGGGVVASVTADGPWLLFRQGEAPDTAVLYLTRGPLIRGSEVVDLTALTGARSIPEWALARSAQEVAREAQQTWMTASRTPRPEGDLLSPLTVDEVWGAGVTYERSRIARQEETRVHEDLYAKVYEARRPELFFKAPGSRVARPGAPMGLRRDGGWHVPEPELTVIVRQTGEIFGYTLGNDLTARDIEAENPLYLPQAKMFHASVAFGPAVALADGLDPMALSLELSVRRHGRVIFSGQEPVARLRRSLEELIGWLRAEWPLAPWTALMTGTGIVPPDDFQLEDGDEVAIATREIGVLVNPVRTIDSGWVDVPGPARRLLVVHPGDDVAVALGALEPGMSVSLDSGGSVTVREAVPFGHKVALRSIAAGEPVRKYGEIIGTATRSMACGDHVHVHNLESRRGRGDLVGGDLP